MRKLKADNSPDNPGTCMLGRLRRTGRLHLHTAPLILVHVSENIERQNQC